MLRGFKLQSQNCLYHVKVKKFNKKTEKCSDHSYISLPIGNDNRS